MKKGSVGVTLWIILALIGATFLMNIYGGFGNVFEDIGNRITDVSGGENRGENIDSSALNSMEALRFAIDAVACEGDVGCLSLGS